VLSISPFCEASSYCPGSWQQVRGVRMAGLFRDPADEYRGCQTGPVVFDRSDRGLLTVAGRDRQRWLNALVTSPVTILRENQGQYAFAVNIQGRILFDLNILCLPETLWLDTDALAVPVAAGHFDRYLIHEDVRVQDVSGQFARLGCCGPKVELLAAQLGVADLRSLPALASRPLADGISRLVRHDFAGSGSVGFELVIPRGEAASWWDRVVELGARPAGFQTLDLLRIEAGIPWLGRDLDETVSPPETGPASRAVSYPKGRYLGQEVIERMRSGGGMPERLVQLRVADGDRLELPTVLRRDSLQVGRITSLSRHPLKPYWPGLGYLKTTVTGYADIHAGSSLQPVTICSP